ncbi:hypothetical protein TNCV_788071 [Trichonephila clavipes]|nr:hypothetical protein TNCV_788071 [Trichonephila clavipes]
MVLIVVGYLKEMKIQQKENNSSLLACLQERTGTLDQREKNHACVLRKNKEDASKKHGTYYLPVSPAAVRSVRRLRRIVRSQTLAQITTQLIYGASPTVRKWTAQHSLHCMGFGSCRPT